MEIDESKIIWLDFLADDVYKRPLPKKEIEKVEIPLQSEDLIPEFDYKKIGIDFKDFRDTEGYANEKLAEIFNISQPLIYRIINGQKLSYRTVVKVCNVLNKDINTYITNGAEVDLTGSEFSRKLGLILREKLKTATAEEMAAEIGIGKVVLLRIAHSQSEQYPYVTAIKKTLKWLKMDEEEILKHEI